MDYREKYSSSERFAFHSLAMRTKIRLRVAAPRRRCCRRREGRKEIDFGRVPWFYLVPLIRSIRSDNGCRKKEKTWLKSGTQGKPVTGIGYHIVTNRIFSRIATRNSILNLKCQGIR